MRNMNDDALKLRILGVPPAFKNSKAIFRKKDGTPFIATNPKYKKWMENTIVTLRSQLRFLSQATTEGMRMESCPHALIALLQQSKDFDDSIQWMPKMEIEVHFLHQSMKENERTEIEIQLI